VADLSVPYTLSTPAGTVIFNNGTLKSLDDLFWIQTIQGLDQASIRAPVDEVPFGNGGIVHTFWKGPRRVIFDGVIFIQSVPIGSGSCQALLNEMEEDLRQALDSISGDTDGTLTWTPTGMSGRSLDVRCEVPFDPQPIEDYALRSFSFGLVSASADWT